MTIEERNADFMQIRGKVLREVKSFVLRTRFKDGLVDLRDLEQEAALQVLYALDRYDPERNQEPFRFVKRRIYGAIVDFFRHADRFCVQPLNRRRASRQVLQVVSFGLAEDIPEDAQPFIFTGQANAVLCSELLRSLSPVERAVIVRRYWLDESFEEIAPQMGFAQACGAWQGHQRAIRKLRKKLACSTFRSEARLSLISTWTLTPAAKPIA